MAENDKAIQITKTTAAVLGVVLLLAGGVFRAVGCERGASIIETIDDVIDSPPLTDINKAEPAPEPAPE